MKKNVHQFCSNKCQKEYIHRQTHEDRKCEICGTIFHVSKKSTQRFCSEKCQHEWQKTRIGIKNPKFTGKLIECDWCGKEHSVQAYKLDTQNHFFCSKECRREWYKNIWSQNAEWKEKSRKRAIRLLESGYMPHTCTKPQKLVNNLLDKMKIHYINEYNLKYYALDNYLPEYGLMIEVMGDYWHCNPVYSRKIPNSIRKGIFRDKAKHSYCANHYNVEILYLWEYDIVHNIRLCELLIEAYVNSKGKLKNYHSFNYHCYEDALLLNDIIVIPYMDYSKEEINQICML